MPARGRDSLDGEYRGAGEAGRLLMGVDGQAGQRARRPRGL